MASVTAAELASTAALAALNSSARPATAALAAAQTRYTCSRSATVRPVSRLEALLFGSPEILSGYFLAIPPAMADPSVTIWAAAPRRPVKFVPPAAACSAAATGPDTESAGSPTAEFIRAPRPAALGVRSPFHRSPNCLATAASGPVKTAVMLAARASEFPPRPAVAAAASSGRPRAAEAAAARYTCSSRRPASRARSWAAVVSGPLATVVVVVDSSTWPLAELLGLPQPVASSPRLRTAAPTRRARRCTALIVVSLSRPTSGPGHYPAPSRHPGSGPGTNRVHHADRRHPRHQRRHPGGGDRPLPPGSPGRGLPPPRRGGVRPGPPAARRPGHGRGGHPGGVPAAVAPARPVRSRAGIAAVVPAGPDPRPLRRHPPVRGVPAPAGGARRPGDGRGGLRHRARGRRPGRGRRGPGGHGHPPARRAGGHRAGLLRGSHLPGSRLPPR